MPEIVHRYLKETKINKQPPGFADFLRGTLTLYQYSKKYNYKFKFDVSSHPIFKFLNIPSHLITNIDSSIDTIELTPPISYNDMDTILTNLFLKNEDIYMLTNAFYKENEDIINDYLFAQSFLKPNETVINYINTTMNEIGLNISNSYIIIHLRLGDRYLVDKNSPDYYIINRIRDMIMNIKTAEGNKQVLFIADCKHMKDYVRDLCFITNTTPIHTGSLDTEHVDDRILNTLSEFFIMSNSEKIYCLNYYDGSGYSRICARIFNKPYIPINI